ncbi:glycosyltransferase involved in cell wall biosynthesis [Paenibacillus sp. JGP012]|uniref:glycosyltransferase n=1 Tax=Paenibacillus sp. JGP012 TaxID=2735914 RepID=UPI00160B2027|nr:glycosyltransferase [Paenibacillus sp. JGP012]MBB6019781.1 glycosyltransferase involved in cell wall biosynthesis [Paenibacillus sp. JGP012]
MKNGISLCMIVKDEGKCLDRCLRSISDKVDEIVVVDTGSTDDSRAIARQYRAEIIDMEWNGDFSEARNLSLAAASYSWILVLDADEVWTQMECTKSELLEWLEAGSQEVWGYWIKVTSLLGTLGEERVTDEVCRLFRNDPRIAFHGRIHEEAASSIQAFIPGGIGHSDIEIVHYGYLDDVIAAKGKNARNMQLIRLALQQTPDREELLYALAAEWFQQARYEEAIRLLLPLLAQLLPECGYHSDVVLKTAYAWRELGYYGRALAVVETWAPLYGDFPDLLELGAVLELDHARADNALGWLKQAKSAASTAGRYTSVSGAGTYRALTLEGMAYEQTGRWNEAEAAYTAALGLQPDNVAAWQRLLLLGAATGRPQAIARAAERVCLPPAAWQALVTAALAAHRPEWLLRHAAALAPALQAQPLARGLALAQLGEDAAACVALRPWAAHAQHGPEAALALWALGNKRPGRAMRAAGASQGAAVPEAARAADVLLQGARLAAGQRAGTARTAMRGPAASARGQELPRLQQPGATPRMGALLAPAQALAAVGAWPAWLRLLQAQPPGVALALLAALPPAARCGLLRAPAHVREGLLALCGPPGSAQQPLADEVPALAPAAHALLAGTLALLAGRQSLARDWAEYAAQITARPAAAQGRPVKSLSPGLQTLLRLTAPGTAQAPTYRQQCNLLLVYL